MADIKKDIREYIVENFLFGDTDTVFADDDSFMENGLLDSTGILELIMFLENTFDIKVDDEEIIPENLDSLDRLESFINTKKN